MDDELSQKRTLNGRVSFGLAMAVFGLVVFVLGLNPGLFGLDRSPVIGFVQVSVFEVGLGIQCIGGYVSLVSLWKDQPISIAAEIGQRMVATGYLVAVFAGMADIFGFGSHRLPGVPYFGVWQQSGVMIGQFIIAIGFLMLIPYRRT